MLMASAYDKKLFDTGTSTVYAKKITKQDLPRWDIGGHVIFAKHFSYEDPATQHTASVVCDGYFYKVEEIDGKAAVSRWYRSPKTAVKNGYIRI